METVNLEGIMRINNYIHEAAFPLFVFGTVLWNVRNTFKDSFSLVKVW